VPIQQLGEEHIMTPPPTTSATDCIGLLVISMVAGLLRYLAARHRNRVSLAQSGDLSKKKDSYFQSPVAFLVSWFPWLMFSLCSIGVSVLRDHGTMIFPWPLFANCLLLSLWLSLARRMQLYYTTGTGTAE